MGNRENFTEVETHVIVPPSQKLRFIKQITLLRQYSRKLMFLNLILFSFRLLVSEVQKLTDLRRNMLIF